MSFSILRPFANGSACAKIVNGNKEVSIASDDSCGSFEHYVRSDIRLFQNDEDVTHVLWADESTVHASIDNLQKALTWLKGE